MTPRRRWYWPRTIAKNERWHLCFAPTFFAFGVGVYPAAGNSPTSVVFGIWPILLGFASVAPSPQENAGT